MNSSKRKTKQASYVYIRMKDQKKKLVKKILVCKSLSLFKKTIQKMFSPPSPVLSILTEDGKILNSTEELENGQTYVASLIDPEFEKKINLPPPPPGSPQEKRTKPFLFTNPLTHINFNELLSQLPDEEKTEPKELESPEPKIEIEIENQDENVEPEKPQSKKRAIPTQAIAFASFRKKNGAKTTQPFKLGVKYVLNNSTKIDMRKISRAPTPSSTSSESDLFHSTSSEDDDASPNKSGSGKSSATASVKSSKTQNTKTSTQSKKNSFLTTVDESTDSDEYSPEAIKKKQARSKAQKQKQLFESQSPFEQMIGEFIQPENVPKCYPDCLSTLTKDRKEFVTKISDMEGEQMYLWIHNAPQQPFLQRVPLQPYHDPTTMQACEFFSKHRSTFTGMGSYVFKSAIIGPRKSGKTTVLANFVDQYFSEIAASQSWKNTFVFVADLKLFPPLFSDPKKMYRVFVTLILNALAHQRPLIQVDLPKIRNQFFSVTEGSRVLFAKHRYPEIYNLCRKLNDIWNDPDAYELWLTQVFLLPVTIAKCVGFKFVSLFYDNFEYGDCLVEAPPPFRLPYNVFTIEFVKYGISHANFMVTCESSTRLFEVLAPVQDDGLDLLKGVDYISTMDVTTDIGSRAHFKFVLDIQEEPQPIQLEAEMCGGVVSFLILWDELNLTIFRLERCDPKTNTYQEAYYEAIAQAQKLVDMLFVCENSKKITVCGVKKVSKLHHYGSDNEDEN